MESYIHKVLSYHFQMEVEEVPHQQNCIQFWKYSGIRFGNNKSLSVKILPIVGHHLFKIEYDPVDVAPIHITAEMVA